MQRLQSWFLPAAAGVVLAACASAPVPRAAAAQPTTAGAAGSHHRDGYESVVRDGQTLYCRAEVQTGTIMRKQICRTGAQIDAAEAAALEQQDRNRRGVDGPGHPTSGNFIH